ncbi:TetR/AcrR family transcriptional regulator [Arenibaculum pallidiluteum]|uniref:TetR/AcrR family transcriptional regulator n=1 Tax=Arenibaculum pallidiluteum TaxID=2812559 RepID=UPI001A95DEEA|nr:TetR/AcrR family transcriptional regulator [Arenibaculum pallidiluteum]
MGQETDGAARDTVSRRLSRDERRRQLLQTALAIVREEGADRLTLGHLAVRAGISKPVAYDHFGTRSGLLIELYRWIDLERVNAFRDAMSTGERSIGETADALAAAYIRCAGDMTDEFHVLGAALAGSDEKAAVFQELLDNCVQMFVSVLRPHTALPPADLERCCVGLVGAGEALSALMVRGRCTEAEAIEAFASLIRGGLQGASR